MKTTALVLLAAFAVVMIAGGCNSVPQPTAKISGVHLTDITLQSATLVFDVDVANPYGTALPLVNMDYGLSSGGAKFLSGQADIQGTVPANGTKRIPMPAKVVYADLIKAVSGVKPGAVVPYLAELGLSVDVPIVGRMRLPLKHEGKAPIPTAPGVEVADIRWDKIATDEIRGTVKLNVTNRNEYALDLTKLQCVLKLGDIEVANTSIAKAVKCEASGGAGQLEMPISFSPMKAGLAVIKMVSGSGGGYSIRGTVELNTPFGAMALPFDKAGNTTFRK